MTLEQMEPEQLDVAASFIEGRDMLAVSVTGFGNSLSYACLPVAFYSFTNKVRGACRAACRIGTTLAP